jgi:hypothetical protein
MPIALATVQNTAIHEASGLAASALHRDVYYLHNDSGDSARFFAIDATGADLGTFEVSGASAIDWEDMARGPCQRESCLWFGDIGDNALGRSSYVIYRVAEPSQLGPGTHAVEAEAFPFSYPDGSHNAETLLVHPETGVVTIVTKEFVGPSSIYELPVPLTNGQPMTAVKVGEVEPAAGANLFTAGDVHPAGAGVLLRTYTNLFFFAAAPGQSVAQTLATPPCVVPVAAESQGEAVGWTQSGSGWVTISEGVTPELHAVDCAP